MTLERKTASSHRACSRCVLPGNYRGIRFDDQGVCNYCRTHEKFRDRLTDFETLARLREERFERARAAGRPYDALVGLSGGKDSSWLAFQLTRRHGLKCLGFTFDNGFLTDYARHNIDLVTRTLGIDHFFHKVDWDLQKRFYQQAVRSFGTPCPACSYSSYALSYKLAFERQIPLVIHGRSRSQMLREFLAGSPDAFLPFVALNLSPYDRETNLRATLAARRRLDYLVSLALPDREMRHRFYEEFFPPMDLLSSAEVLPEFLGYFLYQPDDERSMMRELEQELGWQRPETAVILTHADCAVHDAAGYLFQQAFEYPMLSFELSVLIREGRLTREEALARLAQEPAVRGAPEASLDYLCERLEMKRSELPEISRRVRCRTRWRNRFRRVMAWVRRPPPPLPGG
ncbi:MAG: hypothetical protein V1873_07320 [Verrucomicrobiota bacterium]